MEDKTLVKPERVENTVDEWDSTQNLKNSNTKATGLKGISENQIKNNKDSFIDDSQSENKNFWEDIEGLGESKKVIVFLAFI